MIAIIGTGVVGACVGYYLTREGANVLLIDRGQPGALTTSASLAWVNASSKLGHSGYFELNFEGLREHERLAAGFRDAPWWNQGGHLRWDHRDEHELTTFVEQLRARGYLAEVWETARARLLEPHVVFGTEVARVAVLPWEGWVNGPRLVQALVEAASGGGARKAFGSSVRSITVTDRTVTAVELDNGKAYAVDKVVNAAGPGAARVAALVDRYLPMKDRPGLAIRLETSRDWIHRVIHAPGIAIRPDGPAQAFLLARDVEPELRKTGRVSREAVEQVLQLAEHVVPELANAAVKDIRVGHRPIPVDGLPLIGRAGDITGYYEAVTHSGITLAPIVGRALAAEILHDQIDPLVSSFAASRIRAV